MTLQDAIACALDGRDLTRDEMAAAIGQIMDGAATPAQIGGFLVALRAKGEAIAELVGAAAAMRARALPLRCDEPRSIDTCGTGGDGAGTINVSTLAAVLIAACGGVVAKHGNRALSSRCGSADVLEALGVVVDAEPAVVASCIERARIGFAFAPKFHAATRHAAGVRRELGTRTIFNLLGPLTNPAHVRHQVVGVYARAWCEPMAAALGALGVRRAAVVHGDDGLDEISVRGGTHVAVWDDGHVTTHELTPRVFGLTDADPAGLAGGDAAHNAAVLRAALAGQAHAAVGNAAAMTAGLGLVLLEDGALDLAALPAATARAAAALRDGSGARVLATWAAASHGGAADEAASA